MLELKTIGRIAGVELLEHHRSLYEGGGGGVGAGIEDNRSHGGGGAQEDHRSYSLCFLSFLRTPKILAKDAPERFCSASISSTTAAILAS